MIEEHNAMIENYGNITSYDKTATYIDYYSTSNFIKKDSSTGAFLW